MANMEKIKITQIKSPINRTKKQKLTLQALGLRKIGMTVEHKRTPNILGMVKKVSHLIIVEN
jgi:large subunit ribosomal protein L30